MFTQLIEEGFVRGALADEAGWLFHDGNFGGPRSGFNIHGQETKGCTRALSKPCVTHYSRWQWFSTVTVQSVECRFRRRTDAEISPLVGSKLQDRGQDPEQHPQACPARRTLGIPALKLSALMLMTVHAL